MKDLQPDRRQFLRTSAATAAAAAIPAGFVRSAAAAEKAVSAGRIRLGAPVFNAPKDPEGLALAHKQMGYRAAYCPKIPVEDTDRIRDTAAAFAKHDIVIAEVGRWCNLMDADPEKRAANLANVTDGLALAEAIGARCCVDIAGSFNEEVWSGPHPKNLTDEFFDLAVENAREIIDAVKPRRAKFCYEMMGWAIPHTVDSYLALMKAVDRDAFAVHLDPANLINSPEKYFDTTSLINEAFDKLGPHIVSCHAKDVGWVPEMQVHFVEVPLGQGTLDYRTYLKRLAALQDPPPLMVEHMKGAEQYDACRKYVFALGEEIGVGF
ncbi:MAG: sugar phosphate isomerase/epimerase family protein [Planctomycetota bacterium]